MKPVTGDRGRGGAGVEGEREGEGWRKRGRRQGGWEEGKLGVELHLKVGDITTESSRGSFEERSTEPCQCPANALLGILICPVWKL